jgi:cell wall-associated NlpC family hydrolase
VVCQESPRLNQAALYAATFGSGNCATPETTTRAAYVAITYAYACAQLGQPYVWGGDEPEEGGFDCSGLTKAAYAAASGVRHLDRVWCSGRRRSA